MDKSKIGDYGIEPNGTYMYQIIAVDDVSYTIRFQNSQTASIFRKDQFTNDRKLSKLEAMFLE